MTVMRGIDFLLAGGNAHLYFLFRYYILIKNTLKFSDFLQWIQCLTKVVNLLILEMVKKNRAHTS